MKRLVKTVKPDKGEHVFLYGGLFGGKQQQIVLKQVEESVMCMYRHCVLKWSSRLCDNVPC